MQSMRNIGIFAHVDAGKTTLTEQMLSIAGAIRTPGSVDSGTAHTDALPVERRRGISVKATCAALEWRGTRIQLIDTPGHVDFTAEVERALWALDGAVLVVCGVEGVRPQTEVLFEALKEQHMPCVIFVNKMDREGADADRVLSQIRRRLTSEAAPLWDEEALTEAVCAHDDDLLERYLSGEEISSEEVGAALRVLARRGELVPVVSGSALRREGVEAVLDAVVDDLPAPEVSPELCGVAFAAQKDRTLGRGLWVRLFGGRLENRDAISLTVGEDPVTGEPRTVQKKITQICGASGESLGRLEGGEIGVVYGLSEASVGLVLGDESALPRRVEPGRLGVPLITVQAIPESPDQMQALRLACEELSGEDPMLHARYVPSLNELHLNAMGAIQLEILQEMLKTRFDLNVQFTKPAIIYKETIAHAAEGFVAYVMPKPCWAVLRFWIEPAPRGSGVTFESVVPVRDIMARYQHQVRQALPTALRQGRLGWEVTDVHITLVEGEHHLIHTHPLDFIVATPMGIQDGLRRGGTTLLEPILDVRFHLPPDCVGRVMSDVALMRGTVGESRFDGDRVVLDAQVPVSTSLDYPTALAALSSGRAAMSAHLRGYAECPLELGAVARRRDIDPLDTARYILAARSALTD